MNTKRSILRAFAAIPAAAFMLFPALAMAGPDEKPEWWTIDSEINQQLIGGEKNLAEWAAELSSLEPKTSRDAVVKINICMRAALDDDACAAVRKLWQLGPEKVDNHLLTSAYHAATDVHLAWDVALAIVETFAPRIHEISLDNRLIQHFRAEDNKRRWNDDEFLAWLDARVESVRRHDAERKAGDPRSITTEFPDHWRPRPIEHWTRLRLRYLAEMGRAGAELERMAALVRAHPTDARIASDYLSAIKETRAHDGKSDPVALGWMTDTCRPTRATDMQQIASLLVELEQYKAAAAFYQRVIETPITDGEISQRAMMCQAFLPQQTHRLLFEVGIREELATCLLKLGESARSQQLMVEAADMREKHQLPPNPYLAGAVQAASGARVIEGRIRKEEDTNKDDPAYWLQRADYYRGRNEPGQEEEALRHGLALCPPAPQPKGKVPLQMRAQILSYLARVLVRDKRPEAAIDLLLAELKDAPADAASSEAAARMLGFDWPEYLKPDESILWNWLASRSRWAHAEERLLWRMLEAAPRETRGTSISRGEKLALADGADASRAASLGWILNRMDEADRSLPLLKHAVQTATEDDLKHRAAFTLFESHLALRDWRAAESMFGLAEKQLGPKEDVEWLGRVALIAAEKGSPRDAMRIFRKVANCDLRLRQLVADLSKHGLKEDLRSFYCQVRTRLPSAKLDGLPE